VSECLETSYTCSIIMNIIIIILSFVFASATQQAFRFLPYVNVDISRCRVKGIASAVLLISHMMFFFSFSCFFALSFREGFPSPAAPGDPAIPTCIRTPPI